MFGVHHPNLTSLRCNIISRRDDVINDIITHAHGAGHVTFWYKRGRTWWGVGSVTRDLQEAGPLKVCIGINTPVHPYNWSLLPSTVFSVFTCVLFHCMCSDTHTQMFQESLGVLLTPQLVLPLQECCAFRLCLCALHLQ